MKEKFEKVEKYYNYGCLFAISLVAFMLSFFKDDFLALQNSTLLNLFFAFFIFYFILSFIFAGIIYGFSIAGFKLTINPIKLMINLFISCIFCGLFSFIYFFIFIYYLVLSTIETHRERKSDIF